jgi:glycosyltransferase involved in cell wall biosynthesis
VGVPEEGTFDLIVATVDRAEELDRLFGSLENQTHRAFRVIVADQNDDRRVDSIVAAHRSLDVLHLRTPRGLSLARNRALGHVSAALVAFPDDDCLCPNDLLARAARRFADDPALDGLTGRDQTAGWPQDARLLTRDNVWNRAISFTIFLRAATVARIGAFDERLGLPESSGEEIDYLIRALDAGARIEYDPSITVRHDATARPLAQLGARDGASIGVILRKHRYSAATVARMFLRPVGGAFVALGRRDVARARFHAATAAGRVKGYLARSSSKT